MGTITYNCNYREHTTICDNRVQKVEEGGVEKHTNKWINTLSYMLVPCSAFNIVGVPHIFSRNESGAIIRDNKELGELWKLYKEQGNTLELEKESLSRLDQISIEIGDKVANGILNGLFSCVRYILGITIRVSAPVCMVLTGIGIFMYILGDNDGLKLAKKSSIICLIAYMVEAAMQE